MPIVTLPDGRRLNVPDDPTERKRLADALRRQENINLDSISTPKTGLPKLLDIVQETPKAFIRGAARTTLSVPKGYVAGADVGNDSDALQTFRNAQKWLNEESAVKRNPDYDENYWLKLVEGGGSIVPFVAGGFGKQILERQGSKYLANAIMPAIAAPTGISTQSELIDMARAEGKDVSIGQELLSETVGAGIGLTEIIPIEKIFSGIPKSRGKYGNNASLNRALKSGLFEGTQETVASIAQNLTSYAIYNPDIAVTDSMFDDFTIGGIVGGVTDYVVNAIGGKRSIGSPYLYEAEKNLRETQGALISEERARLRAKYENALKAGEIFIEPSEKEMLPDIPLPSEIMAEPNLEVIENPNDTFSVIDLNNQEQPVLATVPFETDALVIKERKRKEFENEVIRQLVDNDLYNLGLINSGTAKELAVTLNSANSTNINAKLMSIYDEQISQARKDQLVEEAEADRKYFENRAKAINPLLGFSGAQFGLERFGAQEQSRQAQEQLERTRLVEEQAQAALDEDKKKIKPLVKRKPQVNMLEELQNKAEKKGFEKKNFYSYAEAKKILSPKDFNQLVKEQAAVSFRASEKMGKPSIVADKMNLKEITTPKYVKELAQSKNIDLDFKDDAVKYAAQQWTGTPNYKSMSQSQKELFVARLNSLSRFGQETKFPNFRPRNYTAEDTANFVASVSTDISFSDSDVEFAVGKENKKQFIDDLISSGRAEKIGPQKYKLVDNFEFNIARRAEGFNETPEEFEERLRSEARLPNDVINEVVSQEREKQAGLLPPEEMRKKFLDFGRATQEAGVSKFAVKAREKLNEVGLGEVGLVVSDEILSTTSLRNVGDKVIFDPKQTQNAPGEYDPALDTIFIATSRIDPDGNLSDSELEKAIASILDHEIIHPLLEKDLFTESQFLYLRDYVKKKKVPKSFDPDYAGKTFYQRATEMYAGIVNDPSYTADQIEEHFIEEAIADVYRARTFEDFNVPPKADRLLDRITNFFKSIIKAMRSVGYRNVEQVFSDIEQGRVGNQERNKIRTLRFLDKARTTGYDIDIKKFALADSLKQTATIDEEFLGQYYYKGAEIVKDQDGSFIQWLVFDLTDGSIIDSFPSLQDAKYAIDNGVEYSSLFLDPEKSIRKLKARIADERNPYARAQGYDGEESLENIYSDNQERLQIDYDTFVERYSRRFERQLTNTGKKEAQRLIDILEGNQKQTFDVPRFSLPTTNANPVIEGVLSTDLIRGLEQLPNIKTKKDLAKALEERTRNANDGKPLINISPNGTILPLDNKEVDLLAEILALESSYALSLQGNASNWYKNDLQTAMDYAGDIFPNIKNNPEQQDLLKIIMGITSNGLSVKQNTNLAINIYENYLRTGQIFGEGSGTSKQAMQNSFDLLNALIQSNGLENTISFMKRNIPVKDLDAVMSFATRSKKSVGLESKNAIVKGSSMFGPKIGGGFIPNLLGDYTALTPDRWFMRTWGRTTGTLLSANQKALNSSLSKFRSTIKAGNARKLGIPIDQIRSNDDVAVTAAIRLYRDFAKRNFQNSTALDKSARSVWKADQELTAPKTITEVDNMRKVMSRSVQFLKQKGYPDVDVATVQASLWYAEKDLYNKYLNIKSEVTSYAEQFEEAAKERGVNESDINRTRETARQRTTASVQRNLRQAELEPDRQDGEENLGEYVVDIPKFSLSQKKKAEEQGFDTKQVYFHGSSGFRIPNGKSKRTDDGEVTFYFGHTGSISGESQLDIDRDVALKGKVNDKFLKDNMMSITSDPNVAYIYARTRLERLNKNPELIRILGGLANKERYEFANENLRDSLMNALPLSYIYPMYLKKDINLYVPRFRNEIVEAIEEVENLSPSDIDALPNDQPVLGLGMTTKQLATNIAGYMDQMEEIQGEFDEWVMDNIAPGSLGNFFTKSSYSNDIGLVDLVTNGDMNYFPMEEIVGTSLFSDYFRYITLTNDWLWLENPATSKFMQMIGFNGVALNEEYGDLSQFRDIGYDETIYDDVTEREFKYVPFAPDMMGGKNNLRVYTDKPIGDQIHLFNPSEDTFVDKDLIIELPSSKLLLDMERDMTGASSIGKGRLTKSQVDTIKENYFALKSFKNAQTKSNFILVNFLSDYVVDRSEFTQEEFDSGELLLAEDLIDRDYETYINPNLSEEQDRWIRRLVRVDEMGRMWIDDFVDRIVGLSTDTGSPFLKFKDEDVDILVQDLINYKTYKPNAIDAEAEQGVIKDENIQASNENKTKIAALRDGGFADIIRSRTGRTYNTTLALNKLTNETLSQDNQNTALAVATLYNEKLGRPKYKKKQKTTNSELQTDIANEYSILVNYFKERFDRARRVPNQPVLFEEVNNVLSIENNLTREIYDSFAKEYPQLVKDHNIRNYKDLVLKSYDAFAKEIEMQYAELLNTGITIEYHDGAAQYMDSNELQNDVVLYDHLWVFKGGDLSLHPFLSIPDRKGITLNDKFRAVHDYFGHVANNNAFGATGEETAFVSHAQMFSPLAAIAMATETRGQNSYVNYANDGQLNADLLRLSEQAARSRKLLELTGDPIWGNYANELSDAVSDNFNYAEQIPFILNAKFLKDVIPDNIKGETVSEGRRKATELTENTPKGDIPYYNTNASYEALDAAIEFNEDPSAVAPKDIPKFSSPSIPLEIEDALDIIGKPDRPDQSWGARMIGLLDDPVTNIKQSFEDFRSGIVDGLSPLEKRLAEMSEENEQVRAINNTASTGAIQAIRMSDASAGLTARMMMNGTITSEIEGMAALSKVVPMIDENGVDIGGPVQFLAPLFENPDIDGEAVFKLLLVAGRGEYLNDKGIMTPVNELVIERANWVKKQARYQKIVQAAEHYQIWNNSLVKFAKEKGLVSEDMAKIIEDHSVYYPFYRQMEDENADGVGFASGYLSNNPLALKMKGSDKEINLNPLEAISRNALAIVTASLKNDGAYKLVKSMEAYGSARELTGRDRENISSLNVIKVFQNGQQTFWEIDDPEVYHSYQALGITPINNGFTRLLAGTSGFLRDMITRDPGFIAVNMLRDTISAYVTSGAEYTPLIDTLKGFTGDISELENFGVVRGYDFANDEADIVKNMRKAMVDQGLTPENGMNPEDMVIKAWDYLGGLTTKSDGATRMATYVDVYNRMKSDGYSEADAQSEAAFQALEIINFGRRGNNPHFRIFTASVPFLNARIQGLDVLYRGMSGKYPAQDRLESGETRDAVKKRIMKRVYTRYGLLFLTTLAYYMMVSDNEEYKNVTREKRDNNWLIPTPWGNIWIPIPFEVGVIGKVIPERLLDILSGDPVEQNPQKTLAQQARNSLNIPLFQTAFGIQLFKPLREVAINRNDYTGSEIVPYHKLGLEPEMQAYESTNEVAKYLGKLFNASPLKVQHVMNGYTGTIGGYLLTIMDMAVRKGTGSPLIPTQLDRMPFIKRFYAETGMGGGFQQQFYELGSEVDRFVQTTNFLRNNGRMDEMALYMQNNRGLQNVQFQVRAIEKYLKYWRARRDQLMKRTDLSQSVKRQAMKDLIQERDQRLLIVPELIKRSKQTSANR